MAKPFIRPTRRPPHIEIDWQAETQKLENHMAMYHDDIPDLLPMFGPPGWRFLRTQKID